MMKRALAILGATVTLLAGGVATDLVPTPDLQTFRGKPWHTRPKRPPAVSGGGGGALADLPLLQSTTGGDPSINWIGKVFFKNDQWSTEIDGGCSTLAFGMGGLGLSEDGTKIFLGGKTDVGCRGYYNIPALGGVGTRVATSHTAPSNLLDIRGGDTTAAMPGSALWLSSSLAVFSWFGFYDTSDPFSHSHWTADPSTMGSWVGPFRFVTNKSRSTRFTAGWMAKLPAAWATAFGEPALAGLCCNGIVSGTSYGPAASVWDPADINGTNDVPATELVGYAQSDTLTLLDGLNYGQGTARFNASTTVMGAFPVEGTRTLLFVGRRGTTFHAAHPEVGCPACHLENHVCYGPATTNSALWGTPDMPGNPLTNEWCYDPYNTTDKGYFAYPYEMFVYAYDALDLLDAKNGVIDTDLVEPYAIWAVSNATAAADAGIPAGDIDPEYGGVAYDPLTQRIYITNRYTRNLGPGFDGVGYPQRMEVFTVTVP
jgi:hypothetical protein